MINNNKKIYIYKYIQALQQKMKLITAMKDKIIAATISAGLSPKTTLIWYTTIIIQIHPQMH